MKKVTAFIGSGRKQATYEAVREFENNLRVGEEIDFEIVFLKDFRLEFCRGCKMCFNNGEECCPLKDDRDRLIEKMNASDGVIFATPNYAFQLAAPMKNLLDRLAFTLHRPQYFGKAFTSVVTQGIYGGGAIIKYLNSTGEKLGFSVTKGCVLKTLEPMTTAAQKKISCEIKKASERFRKELMRSKMPSPSLLNLLLFRMSRSGVKAILNSDYRDYRYYAEKGWFESDYYYEARMGPAKKLLGHLFDFAGRRLMKQP